MKMMIMVVAFIAAWMLSWTANIGIIRQDSPNNENYGQGQELIILFDEYLHIQEINDILMPHSNRFKINHEQNGDGKTDFVVIQTSIIPGLFQEIEDLRLKLEELPKVKSANYNRKIIANFSAFSNLHETKHNDPIFFDGTHGRTNHQKVSEDITYQAKRELFLKGDYSNLYDEFELWKFHEKGFTGKGIKIAIFDSGISEEVQNQVNVVEKIDFTNDGEDNDRISHGTLIASVIGSKNSDWPGVAPDAELYIFKVFNKDNESYTQWFLKAFNYAIEKGIDIINLSNGSSDFKDNLFVEKINEMTANGITVVSSIGNDGPEQGTLNNPADMTNVIGVGSVNKSQKNIAHFSSRGITTWNLLKGVGIIKPDVVTLGEKVSGLYKNGVWTVSSGTSVSSGIISGSIALILSGLKETTTKPTPALIKKTLITTATKLENVPVSDQGSGQFNLNNALNTIKLLEKSETDEEPISSALTEPYVHPKNLNLTSEDYYPYSLISFYSTMMPVAFNFTVINPETDIFEIEDIRWEAKDPVIQECLQINYEISDQQIPYYASIRMLISVSPSTHCQYSSTENVDIITYLILSNTNKTTNFSVTLKLQPTPPRTSRILFDAYHNLKFPEDGYILRDSIFLDMQPYEWKGDHIFTNYMHLYKFLTLSEGYVVEVLNEPITCFDSKNYMAYVVADPERAFTRNEVVKLQKDIEKRGMSLILLADWSEPEIMGMHKFTSQVTGKIWEPAIGGSNLGSINTLLKPYGIGFKESWYSGSIVVGEEKFDIESGALIEKFPNKGYLFSGTVTRDLDKIESDKTFHILDEEIHPIVGVYDLSDETNDKNSGSILVVGDSYWIESASPTKWFNLFSDFLYSLNQKYKQSLLFSEEHYLKLDFSSKTDFRPIREVFSNEPEVCVGPSFYDTSDELDPIFKYARTKEFMTKWKVTDDWKYSGYDDFWDSLFEFKTEIALLSVVAFLLLSGLLVYVWYQRKRNIQYMKIVPDVDI